MNKKISFVDMRFNTGTVSGIFIMFLLSLSTTVFSQQNHFVYFQSDSRQPFYIKHNNKIHSSSASGYLIVSKLPEGTMEIFMGFPKMETAEITFQLTIEKSDKGYLIKRFPEKGWGLFDLQQSSVIYASAKQPGEQKKTETNPVVVVENDPFANMLSQVTQDSTVKNVTVKKEEKILIDTPKIIVTEPVVTNVVMKDTPVQTNLSVKLSSPETPETTWVAPAKATIKQIRKFESREGLDFVFEVTESPLQKDTVRLFISVDSNVSISVSVTPIEVKKDTIVAEIPTQVKVDPVQEIKKEEIKENKPTIPVETVKEQKPENKITEVPNSNCKSSALEEDFIKLRRRMAQQSKEDQMVSEAKKMFRQMCFSTAQIKNLSVLFLTDEWRYRFYDAAFPFVTDFSNFKTLESTIQDEYYKKRFLALIPNN